MTQGSVDQDARALSTLIERIEHREKLKAWSLIITFFGDAVLPRGGVVAAKTLQSIMERFGIAPGTTRTAISRLAADDWILREKSGRNSYYTLSPKGIEQFASASKLIYAGPAIRNTPGQKGENIGSANWLLALKTSSVNSDRQPGNNAIPITPNCQLYKEWDFDLVSSLQKQQYLILRGDLLEVPDWLTDQLAPDTIRQGYLDILQIFKPLQQSTPMTPLDAAACRCLLIHEWRRLLLRQAPIPIDLMPTDWPQESCRQFVASLYHQFSSLTEEWLDSEFQNTETQTASDGSFGDTGPGERFPEQ